MNERTEGGSAKRVLRQRRGASHDPEEVIPPSGLACSVLGGYTEHTTTEDGDSHEVISSTALA
jgi:hypothetical protein